MRIFGFKYCTGIMYCDLDTEEHGDYKEVAYVWENGEIDWRVPMDSINEEGRKRILKCSLEHSSNVTNLQTEYEKKYAEYGYLLNREDKGLTLFECNMKRWLYRVKVELSDLMMYKTTMVVHH